MALTRAVCGTLQAEDRAHRIGQLSAVNIHYIIARETVDESMWRALQRKVRCAHRIARPCP